MSDRRLWYKQAASCFEEALPIGNGHIGAMVYGGVSREKISLNEDTLWSGAPKSCLPAGYEGAIDDIRRLMAEGNRDTAARRVWQRLMGDFTACYAPAGELNINMGCEENVADYVRELDLESGVTTVRYTIDGVACTREIFCSFPDDVIVIRLRSEKPILSGSVAFNTPHPFSFESNKDGFLFAHSKMPYNINLAGHVGAKGAYYDEEKPSVRFCMGLFMQKNSGTTHHDEGLLRFENADDVVLLLNISTDFESYEKTPCGTLESLREKAANVLKSAAVKDFSSLKQAHSADHSALFSKADLKLGGIRRDSLPTDERLKANAELCDDVGLQELLFQYGRYLLIACSRPGSQPANLQGVWNEHVLAPWCSGYTLNINLPMNYWPAESTGLAECHQPLLSFIRELSERGRESASVYGCRGWCAHHNTDLWRYSGMVGRDWRTHMPGVAYACWLMGGAWLTHHIWEHYAYSGDADFLRKNFDIMRGNVRFILDFLTENSDGYLVPSFGTTPENSYLYKGEKIAICQGATEDMAIIRNSILEFESACKTLGVKDEVCDEAMSAFEKLLPYQIGERGQLCEWEQDFENCDVHHVNMAPMWGCYPGNTITPLKTPELANAARVLMEERGDNGTGHSLCWKMCLRARLGDTERAYDFLKRMLQLVLPGETNKYGGVYPNLLDVHPPFQIDGNFGVTAGITEMLIQSHNEYIELLPSLPSAWKDGGFSGLVTRGGFVTDVCWRDNKLLSATLKSLCDGVCRLRAEKGWKIFCGDKPLDNAEGGVLSFAVKRGDICKIVTE